MSHVMCQVTWHMSRVTYHVSPYFKKTNLLYYIFLVFGISGEACWWRVCYQRGLPCKVFTETPFKRSMILSYLVVINQCIYISFPKDVSPPCFLQYFLVVWLVWGGIRKTNYTATKVPTPIISFCNFPKREQGIGYLWGIHCLQGESFFFILMHALLMTSFQRQSLAAKQRNLKAIDLCQYQEIVQNYLY